MSIETSTKVCSVAIHQDGVFLSGQIHHVEKSHSSLLPGIALDTLKKEGLSLQEMDAFAASGGPGSYTGLRIGVSTIKGFCYTLEKPMIAVSSLETMVAVLRGRFKGHYLLCPMMDARRMEVYTYLESASGKSIWREQAKVLDANTFEDFTEPVYIFGDGMPKFRSIAEQENLRFIDEIFPDAKNMGEIVERKYREKDFEDVAYYEPNYLKEWQTTTPKKRLNI